MHTLETKGVRRMEEQARLAAIEHNRKITKDTDGRFLFEYQRAILLTLKADGLLDETQYHYAEERLRRQTRNHIINQNSTKERGEAS